MDDFNLDGFADLFIMSDTEMLVATAANVNDNNAGMVFGPALTFPASSFATNFDPTSGDFNGDGLKDIAGSAATIQSISPQSVQGPLQTLSAPAKSPWICCWIPAVAGCADKGHS